jgi:cysteine synthase B
MIIENISALIGNTPLLKIPEAVHQIPNLDLYCKLEMMNAFGSIKDRIGLNLLNSNIADCKKNGKTVLEASSGNTAKALAILSSINGLNFKTVSNRIKSHEMKELLLLLNAEIEELPGFSECPDPNNPDDYMNVAKSMSERNPDTYFYTDQYFNEKNPEAHEKTAEEIINDLEKVDFFFSILGTAGSSTGTGRVLKSKIKSKIIGVLTDRGSYVPGARTLDEMWEVGFFERNFYDEILAGSTNQAIEGMLTLIRKVGLLCGPTSGLSYQLLLDFFTKNPPKEKTTAVFVACDRVELYLSYIEKHAPSLIGKHTLGIELLKVSNEEIDASKEITATELKESINDVMIIDVRSNEAYEMFHLPNSINLPTAEHEDFFGKNIPFAKNRRIIVACSKGKTSKKLTAFLTKNGFDAASLSGGVFSWNKV